MQTALSFTAPAGQSPAQASLRPLEPAGSYVFFIVHYLDLPGEVLAVPLPLRDYLQM